MTYKELTDVAKEEQNQNACSAIKDRLQDFEQRDTICLMISSNDYLDSRQA